VHLLRHDQALLADRISRSNNLIDSTERSSYGFGMAELDLTEMHRSLLDTPEAWYALGAFCANALKRLGVVTLVVRPDGFVAYCTPSQVHILKEAVPDPEIVNRPFVWVRPVVSDGRPQWVGWRNGELWEIRFEEEPDAAAPKERAGEGDH
jgi:hypothetical protein